MAKNKEVHKKLRDRQSEWEGAEPQTFSTIKDGDYIAKITEMSIEESKAGRIQVVTTFKVMDGKMKGKEVKKFDGLESDQNMSFFKGFCEVLGIEIPEDLTDLPEVLDEFVADFDSLVNITAKTKDEYQNIRVKGLSDYSSDDEDDDDDEPKSKKKKSSKDDDDDDDEPKSKKKKSSKDDDDDDDSDDDGDDDEPKSKKKKSSKDEDEDEDQDEGDHKKKKKNRR